MFSTAQGDAITFTDSFAGQHDGDPHADGHRRHPHVGLDQRPCLSSRATAARRSRVTGTLANLNTAVSGLTYTPNGGFSGSDGVQIGLTDTGDNLSANATVGLTVQKSPTVNAPSAASLKKNATFPFSGGNAISVTDPAAGNSAEQVTLHASHGTLKLATTKGLTIVSGANKSASVTVSGTLATLNSDLNGLVYTPASGYSGSDSLTVSATDRGDGLTSPTATVASPSGWLPRSRAPKRPRLPWEPPEAYGEDNRIPGRPQWPFRRDFPPG